MLGLLIQLFWTFFLIGMFTFGGGYAVMGIIQSEVVTARGWITESMFTDIVAVSQITPGPVGLNCSTYVGYEVLRNAGAGQFLSSVGSLTASLAVVLPSFIIMLAIVKFYTKFHETRTFSDTMGSLKPAVAGLIGASALMLALSAENFPDWKAWVIGAAAFLFYTFIKADPLKILAGGALLGLLLY